MQKYILAILKEGSEATVLPQTHATQARAMDHAAGVAGCHLFRKVNSEQGS